MASIITNVGREKIASLLASGDNLDIKSMVFANIPGKTETDTPSAASIVPEALVFTSLVTSSAIQDSQTAVYSCVLDSLVGDFDFNYIGLVDVDGILIAAAYQATQHKRAGAGFVGGNTFYKSFALKVENATQLTKITIPPGLWQYDGLRPVIGTAIGTVFSFAGIDAPAGAYYLNGQWIDNCANLYPKFWELISTLGNVRTLSNTEYEAELAAYGECGAFVFDSDDSSSHVNGVRLPKIVNALQGCVDLQSIGNVTQGGRCLIKTWSSEDQWYRIYSDGWCEQGGYANPSNGRLVINLFVPFVDGSAYNVNFTPNDTNGNKAFQADNYYISSKTASAISYGSGYISIGRYWHASGYVPIPTNINVSGGVRYPYCVQVYTAVTDFSTAQASEVIGQMQGKAGVDLENVSASGQLATQNWVALDFDNAITNLGNNVMYEAATAGYAYADVVLTRTAVTNHTFIFSCFSPSGQEVYSSGYSIAGNSGWGSTCRIPLFIPKGYSYRLFVGTPNTTITKFVALFIPIKIQ